MLIPHKLVCITFIDACISAKDVPGAHESEVMRECPSTEGRRSQCSKLKVKAVEHVELPQLYDFRGGVLELRAQPRPPKFSQARPEQHHSLEESMTYESVPVMPST